VKAYYERRAPEYDDWYTGAGLFAERDRPGWHEELEELVAVLERFPAARTLDVACGTGFLTRHLSGELTLLDQSAAMLEVASARIPSAILVQSDAPPLPFPDATFERVFTGHFYGHLDAAARDLFVAEARRVADELVVVDSALRAEVEPEDWQERVLNDGSRHAVYKRYFTPAGLAAELGGGETLHAGRWFVAVRA